MIIVINKADLGKKVCDLDDYRQGQFKLLCRNAYGDEKFFQVLGKHTVSDLRRANGLGIDRFLAIPGEIR